MKMYCHTDFDKFHGELEYKKGHYYPVRSDFFDGYAVEDENGKRQSFSKNEGHSMNYTNWFHLID